MGAIIVTDALWGDAGKGKFSAYLSLKEDADICVRAGIGPNAGHSVLVDGRLLKTRLVPLGLVNKRTKLLIGSGVTIDPLILIEEVRRTRTTSRLGVDFRCPIIEDSHKEIELKDDIMVQIDSTRTGAGAARADYIMRKARRAVDVPSLRKFTRDVAASCNKYARSGTVVIEGSQATFLSLYLSPRYPYVTSDNCTALAYADDVGLNWRLIDRVLLLVKCLPTAVGNGPLPNEMTLEEIEAKGLVEFGTNTGRRRRRVRKLPLNLLRYAAMINGPTEIGLTHCDQYDRRITNCKRKSEITRPLLRLVAAVERATQTPVRYLETGKDLHSIIDLF